MSHAAQGTTEDENAGVAGEQPMRGGQWGVSPHIFPSLSGAAR
jgi:hypothetical protein